MAVSAPGVGSSIDVNSIITQLMALERRPLDALNQRQREFNTQLSAYGKVKSDLSAFQSAVSALKSNLDFSVFKASSSNADVMGVSADSSALSGVHSITVGSLAKSHIQVAATGFANTDTAAVGNIGDTLTFTSGTNTFTVTLDASNNTLSGLQDAINAASGNYGVRASILNDGSANGNRLVITANESGTANAVTLSGTLATSLSFATTQAAANATLTVDGVTGITKASNTVDDVLPGVTLTLKSTGSADVTVESDSEAITKLVQNLVSAYNTLVGDMTSLRAKGGDLEADNTLLTIRNQLNDVFNNAASGGAYKFMSEIGISLQKDGKLALDSSAFNAALDSNFADVVNLFSNSTNGVAVRFYDSVTALLQTDGIVDARTDGLDANIKLLDTRMEQMEYRLEKIQERLRAQYSALDSTLGVMKQTSNYLLAQLG